MPSAQPLKKGHIRPETAHELEIQKSASSHASSKSQKGDIQKLIVSAAGHLVKEGYSAVKSVAKAAGLAKKIDYEDEDHMDVDGSSSQMRTPVNIIFRAEDPRVIGTFENCMLDDPYPKFQEYTVTACTSETSMEVDIPAAMVPELQGSFGSCTGIMTSRRTSEVRQTEIVSANLLPSGNPHPLLIPEILQIVFGFLVSPLNTGSDPSKPLDFVKVDSLKYALSKPKLHSCVLVNKMWNACAMKLLWKHVKVGSEAGCKKIKSTLTSQLRVSSDASSKSICSAFPGASCEFHQVSLDQFEFNSQNIKFTGSSVNGWHYGSLIRAFALIQPHGPNAKGFEKWNVDEVVVALALSCPKLEDLNLNNCNQVTDSSLIILAKHCKHLKRINLNRCDLVTDYSLMELAKNCKNLEIVNFNRPLSDARMALSDASIASVVRDRPNITEIRLRCCDAVSDSTIGILATTANMKLQALDLSWCARITDRAIIAVANNCPNLISLALNGCKRLTDASLDALLRNCHSIASLSFSHLPFITDNAVIRMSATLKNLSILSLNGCSSIRDPSLIALAKACPNIVCLSLVQLTITDKALLSITEHCKKLSSLSISGCKQITDVGAKSIVRLKALQSLYLNEAQITDLSVECISEVCTAIRALSLNECIHLTDRSFVAIGQNLRRLQSLSMNSCGATAVGVQEIALKCEDLRELSVKNCKGVYFKGEMAKRRICGTGVFHLTAIGEEVFFYLLQKRLALIYSDS